VAKKPVAKTKTQTAKSPGEVSQSTKSPANNLNLPAWAIYLLIFLFACALYSNTLWNRYAIDDKIVLVENQFTKKGAAGIKDIFTHDVYEGFLGPNAAKFLIGGRYRPLSIATMAGEYELVRKIRGDKRGELTNQNVIIGEGDPYLSPKLSHAVNLILFALTGILLYYLLLQILPLGTTSSFYFSIPFLATILYIAHPIHTEAIANIKGRDEIMTFLFSLLALLCAIKYVNKQKSVYLLIGMLAYFIALLSKENAITFFAIIPLTYYFFTGAKLKDYIFTLSLYALPVIAFLLLRSKFTQVNIGETSTEILNNPFLLATGSQQFATIIYTFLLYIKLLIFPHLLTHDYYFNQIPYVDIGSIAFILAFIVNAGLLVYAVFKLRKKTVYSYSILFYFITLSIVSNLFFTVGTTMNERFVYISSLGFCIALAYGLLQLRDRFKLPVSTFAVIIVFILSLYSFKTITRNTNWESDASLLKSDIRWSPGSAKIQASLANELIMEADKETDTLAKNQLLDSAIVHANEALRIYPTYVIGMMDLGNALYRKDDRPDEVIPIYNKILALKPAGYYDANYALAVVCCNSNRPSEAKENLMTAIRLNPDRDDPYYLLSQVYARLNQADSVEYWLKLGGQVRPATGKDYYIIGRSFGREANNLDKAIEYFNKAIAIDPKTDFYYYDLSVAYIFSGRYEDAIKTNEKLIQINPGYPDVYRNMAVAYTKLGNTAMANQYREKYNQVMQANKK